jgi:hypothetical protein
MPLIGQDDLLSQINISGETKNTQDLRSITKSDDSVLDVTKAAFQQENIVGSKFAKDDAVGDIPINKSEGTSRPLDEGFRFEDHVPKGYEQYADMFAFTNTAEEANKVRGFVDDRLEQQDIIRRNGITGIAASMAAGILDPTILVPGAALAKGATGARILKGAIAGSATAGVGIGLQEAALQSSQSDTRPMEISRNAVLSGVILGGVLGGSIAGFTRGNRVGNELLVEEALTGSTINTKVGTDGKVTAEFVDKLRSSEGLANINETLAKGLAGPKISRSISLRGVTSEFGTVRKVTNDLFDHNFILNKEIAGEARGTVFERALSVEQGRTIKLNSEVRGLYKSYAGVNSDAGAFVKAKMDGKLSFNEFDEEVGKAMRRGDVHKVPEVEKAAKLLRNKMDEKTTKLQELGILPEELDTKTSTTYFMRRYKTDKIVEEYDEFKGIVSRWLSEQNPNKLPSEIDEIAEKTIDNILGMGDQSLAMSDVANGMSRGKGKFTKERVFLIPDEKIENFLDSRGSGVSTQYITQADSMIQMQEMLNRNGWESINDARKLLRDELTTRLESVTDPSKRTALNKQFREELDLMNNMFRIAAGDFGSKGGADSALRTLRKYQTYRLLGGVTLSSMPDTAMHVFKNGLPRSISDGLVASATNFKASKLSKDQLKDFGIGLELEQNTLLRNLTDPDFRIGVRQNKIEKAADAAGEAFGKITLMTYWNNMHKRVAGHMSTARTFRALSKGTKMDPAENLRLRQMGIDDAMGARINKQFEKYGQVEDGSYIGNFHKWTDKEAKETFGQATLSDVDTTILSPSRGDLPEAAIASELGKTIFQFKSFASTATNKLLISGIQRRDAEVIQGLIGLVGMGAQTYVLKSMVAGREPDTSIDNLIKEGISRSGVTGLFGDYVMGLSNAFLGTQGSSRYAGRSVEGMFLGPSADIVKDLAQASVNATDGELTDKDANALKRMMPFSNIFYMRMLMRKLKDEGDE